MTEWRARFPELRERIRRIERPTAAAHGVLPFGVAAIDRALPGGGLARGALHEILGAGGDEEDGALAAAFAAAILGRLGPHPFPPPLAEEGMGGGFVLWCLARPDLYGPGLAAHGLDPYSLVYVPGEPALDHISYVVADVAQLDRAANAVPSVYMRTSVAQRIWLTFTATRAAAISPAACPGRTLATLGSRARRTSVASK